MAHALDMNADGKACMFYVKETPWHGLGQQVSDNISISDGMKAAGMDWEVELVDTVTVTGLPVPKRAVVRKDRNVVLGAVGEGYRPLQNQESFGFFQPFLDAGECKLHTAGVLHEGRKIWVLAEINRPNSEIVKGDEISKFVLLSNSHDGTTSIRVGYTPIRVVCANTMAQAHSKRSGSSLIRIRHSRSSKTSLDNLRETMDVINGVFEATAEQYRFLASRDFNAADVRSYVKTLLGVENEKEEDISTRTKNIITDIMERIDGPMQDMPGVRGTWWAAYNGVNERLNYAVGRSADNRMESLWFGQNGTLNDKALALAVDYANAV